MRFIRSDLKQRDDDQPELALSGAVRIILAAADFSKEISATVLWLRDYGIDIRCVRLVPYTLDGQVLIHSETVLPLPEARDYLVRISRRNEAVREAEGTAKATRVKYDLVVSGQADPSGPFSRRRLFAQIIRRLVSLGVSPDRLMEVTGKPSLFHVAEGPPTPEEVVRQVRDRFPNDAIVADRFDHEDDELVRLQGKTYVLFNQNSKGLLPLLEQEARKLGLAWRESQVP